MELLEYMERMRPVVLVTQDKWLADWLRKDYQPIVFGVGDYHIDRTNPNKPVHIFYGLPSAGLIDYLCENNLCEIDFSILDSEGLIKITDSSEMRHKIRMKGRTIFHSDGEISLVE